MSQLICSILHSSPTHRAALQGGGQGYDAGGDDVQAALTAAQQRAAKLQQLLRVESDRRLEEELRALLEGAPFIIHRGSDRALRYVWLADVPERKKPYVRWQSDKKWGKKWRKLAPGGNRAALARQPPYHEVEAERIKSVTFGARGSVLSLRCCVRSVHERCDVVDVSIAAAP